MNKACCEKNTGKNNNYNNNYNDNSLCEEISALVSETLVTAGSTFREDKKDAYRRAIAAEHNPKARWVLETILENAEAAETNRSPLCDDTGIPHLLLEVGPTPAGLTAVWKMTCPCRSTPSS